MIVFAPRISVRKGPLYQLRHNHCPETNQTSTNREITNPVCCGKDQYALC